MPLIVHDRLQRDQQGVGMIEMLISLFILAIGLLGVLGMQVNGYESGNRAVFATEAQLLAADMAERIKANDDLDDITDDRAYDGIDTVDEVSDPGCIEAGCSSDEQVDYDAWDWGRQVTQRLPAGRGVVTFDEVSNTYAIKVLWDYKQDEGTLGGCLDGTYKDLICYSTEIMIISRLN